MKRTIALALLAAGLAGAAPLAASAQSYGWGAPYAGYAARPGWYPRRAQGIIAAVNGSNVTLRNGRQIFLHPGTVIAPTGIALQPGMQISVFGEPGGNWAINADTISVIGRAGPYRAYPY